MFPEGCEYMGFPSEIEKSISLSQTAILIHIENHFWNDKTLNVLEMEQRL